MQLQACDFPKSDDSRQTHTHTRCQPKAAPPPALTALWIKPVASAAGTEAGRLLSLSVRLLLLRAHSSQSQLYSLFTKTVTALSYHGTCSFG